MGHVAVLFPGQGSQAWGMGKELYMKSVEAQEVYETANQILGYRFTDKLFNTKSTEIMDTSISQLAIFLTSVAFYKTYIHKYRVCPRYFAGHSVGEYAALVCADVISLEDGIKLVARRAELMQEASDAMEKGAMLAVLGITLEDVKMQCEAMADDGIEIMIANHNDSKQTVVSGRAQDIDCAKQLLEAQGAKTRKLNVKSAFHCRYMQSAKEGLEQMIRDIPMNRPTALVYSNVTGRPYQSIDEIRQLLAEQLVQPVQWYSTIKSMLEYNVHNFVEVGYGDVLGNILLRQNRKEWNIFSLGRESDCDRFMNFVTSGKEFGINYLIGRMLGVLISEKSSQDMQVEKQDDEMYEYIKQMFIKHINEQKIAEEAVFQECSSKFQYLLAKKELVSDEFELNGTTKE